MSPAASEKTERFPERLRQARKSTQILQPRRTAALFKLMLLFILIPHCLTLLKEGAYTFNSVTQNYIAMSRLVWLVSLLPRHRPLIYDFKDEAGL